MKGIVFSEFMEMVDQKFGFDMIDTLIEKSNLASGGLYVAGGTYPHQELFQMVATLSVETKLPVPLLVQTFGEYLFGRLMTLYPHFADGKATPIDFIESIDGYIHVEVRKLYPDAELPRFIVLEREEKKIVMHYISERRMEDFAIGLMKGCSAHYQQPIHIEHEIVAGTEKYTVKFTVSL